MARLFIPGPTDVHPEVLQAQVHPMVGHRSTGFEQLYARLQPRLREIFQTKHRVFVVASSGSGVWEGAMRSVVGRKLLLCVCGAFGQRWAEVAAGNGTPFEQLDVEWGQANLPEQVEGALRGAEFDTLAVVHNETSTGVENPIGEIVARARAVRPDLVIMVDAVSSAGGVPIPMDAWQIDVLVTSSQKCFALPPGLAFAAVSDRALERAARVSHRGWYFDLLLLDKYHQRDTTPATPAISLLYALDFQLDRMLAEGMQARALRHQAMANQVQTWATEHFDLFAAAGYRSKTVTSIRNTRSLSVSALNQHLALHEMSIADGYGPLKDKTFRIGHMGEIQPSDVTELLTYIDEFLQIAR